MTSIRGATTVSVNSREAILEATGEMLRKIIEVNQVNYDEIIDIFFSATNDLNAAYPAAARELGIVQAGLFCVTEMYVPESLPKCIRALVHVDIPGKKQANMNHVYLRGAEVLRPDLIQKIIAVAIDGPSGSGKSTVAKEIAKAEGSIYIDTGAMYRAVAYYGISNNIELSDEAAVVNALDDINIYIEYDNNMQQRLFLNGDDVTEALRTQPVAEGSSIVAPYPAVREKLKYLQQSMAFNQDVVMDGRDIGTHILPNAQVKIFLDASLETRVQRRIAELKKNNQPAEYEVIKKQIEERDHRDITRDTAPLTKADDAIYIKSDNYTVQEIVMMIRREMEKVR